MGEGTIGFAGVAILLGIAALFSTNIRAVRLRVVVCAFALQVAVAALVLYWPTGQGAIKAMSAAIMGVLNYSRDGIAMVFGPLADTSDGGIGFVFAIQVLCIVIFFSSLMSVLYHLRIMQVLVAVIGGGLRFIIGTNPVESLNAAANIFVGQTEAPLAIKPYLGRITDEQLFAIMVSGLASVAGTVLAAYAQLGISLEYLLAASFMSAPGGLLMAKILMPDQRRPDHEPGEHMPIRVLLAEMPPHPNLIVAAAKGAEDGLKLAAMIGAMLIAFVGLIALANGIIGEVTSWFGVEGMTLQKIFGFVFSGLMYVISVPWSEAQTAGAIFGEKIILNEFIAYVSLTEASETLSERTRVIVTFALCGFANLSSIAILLGGLGSLVPEKLNLIGKFGLRAVLAGSLSNLMSACLAGLLLV